MEASQATNVQFVYATTEAELPFHDGQLDIVFGIHSAAIETVKERLLKNHFTDIEIKEYKDAVIYFPNEMEFAKFISAIPGNPDYTLPEMRAELEKKRKSIISGRTGLRDYKYIWKSVKP